MHIVRCSAHWGGGGCLPRGVSAQGDVCPWGGVCSWGVSAWGCLPGSVCPGVSPQEGVCLGGLPDTSLPPHVNRMTDKRLWKYSIAATSLWTVITIQPNLSTFSIKGITTQLFEQWCIKIRMALCRISELRTSWFISCTFVLHRFFRQFNLLWFSGFD